MPSVTIVVVTYNRKKLLKECIDNILSQTYKDFEVLIIDNCSNDGTYDEIEPFLVNPNIHYYNTLCNLGGAGGFNFGIKKSFMFDSKYVWLMDDDCMVKKDSLQELLEFAQSKKDNFGFLSSVVKWKDKSICKMNVQKINMRKKVTDFSKNQKIKFATFVSFFVKKDTIKKVGLPIKDFFIWGDDLEYSSRISRLYPSYLVSDSVVIHKSTNNVGSNIIKDDDNISRYRYAYRNEQYLFKKIGFLGKIYYYLKKKYHIIKIRKSKSANKNEKINIIKNSSKEGKRFNPKIEFCYERNKDINALIFFAEPLSYGGQEAFEINMYKNFDDEKIHYTFCTPFNSNNTTLIDMVSNRNDRIISFDYNFNSKKRKKYILKAIKKVLKNNSYDLIHIQTGSLWALYTVAKLAKKRGIKKVITHSHCTGISNLKYKIIKKMSDRNIDDYVDKYLGCSKLACEWKYPKSIIDNKKYTVINNGIDIDRFSFDNEVRNKYRFKLGITDEFVICNVGRFEIQKNQRYLIRIAEKLILNEVNNFKILIVGEGSLKNEFILEIKQKGLEEKFILLEKRTDIPEIMMAADIFLLPSLFEGLAVTSVESQATGLYTICSNKITEETKITDIVKFLSLENIDLWISSIKDVMRMSIERKKYSAIIAEAGFDSKVSANLLEKIYRGLE